MGLMWKLFFLIALLAALLAAEFAFDYDVRAVSRGSIIRLTGLSQEIDVLDFGNENLSKMLFRLVKCSYLEGNMRYERRLRPDGECYMGNSSGFRLPEPCALDPTSAHDKSCSRTDEGIIKGNSSGTPEYITMQPVKTVIIENNLVTPPASGLKTEHDKYEGNTGKTGKRIIYCLDIKQYPVGEIFASPSPSTQVSALCMMYLNKSGDHYITKFDFPNNSFLEARPEYYHSPQVRIGADTFTEPSCLGCAVRIALMLQFVHQNMLRKQVFIGIRSNEDEHARLLAMMALGLPRVVETVVDEQDTDDYGFLLINWSFLLPLVIVTVISAAVLSWRCLRRVKVNVPLEYSSAMYCAYDREMSGGDSNLEHPRNTYDVGLVETCEKGVLYLSMNAKQTVPYNGERIAATGPHCGKAGCKRCDRSLTACKRVVRNGESSQDDVGSAEDMKRDIETGFRRRRSSWL